MAGTPPAPTLLSPANGATVVQPFVESWSAVTDPSGIVAYNWQISPTSDFANIISNGSTSAPTQATISGLAHGTYFFRVQGASGSFNQGVWSGGRSFTVSGSGPAAPPSPVLQPTRGYSTFHPYEKEVFNWSAFTGAVKYTLQFSLDSTFPVVHTGQMDNVTDTPTGFAIANPEGSYFARVFAINANGIKSAPSNIITFSVFFNNPIGPPPTNLSPLAAGTLTLPIQIMWDDVPNPQPNGYEYEIATDPQFKNVEVDYPQLNERFFNLLTLTPGKKYWRVRSVQGDSTPELPALTAWSTPGQFTVSTAPPTPVSITLARPQLYSGDSTAVDVQLTTAVPAAGANMTATSSSPTAFPVPATVQVDGNFATAGFVVQAGQVTLPTPVTLTVTINGKTSSIQFTVNPPSLKEVQVSPSSVLGGSPVGITLMLNGEAPPPAGALIGLSSNSPVVTVPSTVTATAGFYWAMCSANTTAVQVNTPVTITAQWNGSSVQAQITVLSPPAPAALTLSPSSIAGGSGSSYGQVSVTAPPPSDATFQVSSSNPAVASVSPTAVVPGGATGGGFVIATNPVTVATPVVISVSGAGKTVSSILTVTPAAQVPVSSLTVSPASVIGGSGVTGMVALAAPAPAGGTVVSLASSSPGIADVPSNLPIAAGATSGSFAITTSSVTAPATVTISALGGGVTRTASLTVNPAPQTAVLTVAASGRNGVSVVSTPSGVSAPTGSTRQTSFAVNTSITLSVTSNRDAIWSGACSSGGSKTKTCSFTLTGNATVNANVQ